MDRYKFDRNNNKDFLKNKHIAIVVAYFYADIADKLLKKALETVKKYGVKDRDISIFYTPGAFEVPLMVERLASTNYYHGIITLGAVIRGQTPHFDYICREVSHGIATLNLKYQTPISFGILTSHSMVQTLARAGGDKGNKGEESALAMIEMMYLLACV